MRKEEKRKEEKKRKSGFCAVRLRYGGLQELGRQFLSDGGKRRKDSGQGECRGQLRQEKE